MRYCIQKPFSCLVVACIAIIMLVVKAGAAQVRLSVGCSAQGTVQIGSGTPGTAVEADVETGSTLTVTATAVAENVAFDHWTGDVEPILRGRNPLSMTVSDNASLTAVFTSVKSSAETDAVVDSIVNAPKGSTVIVPAGRYLLSSVMTMTRDGITVRGATGNPADVVFDGRTEGSPPCHH